MRGSHRLLIGVAALVGLVWCAAPAHAQSTATLQGSITDAQNAVMPGVTITIRNAGTGIERTAVTDGAGQYVAASLQPGHYLVVAHLEGFKDQNGETDLGPAQTIVLNLKLGLATLADNGTVTRPAPMIQPEAV